MKAPYMTSDGSKSEVELAKEVFDVQVNVPVLHEAIRGQLAAARSGTASTKTRAEVRGGGAKPWRQKGTGRARQGSRRSPQWKGGGVVGGPKPRDFSLRTNKKVKLLALRSALTDRAREGKVLIVDAPVFEEPETSKAVELLNTWGAQGKTLIVCAYEEGKSHVNAWKSFRNLPLVLTVTYATPYTVLAAETVVLTKGALEVLAPQKGGLGGVAAPLGKDPRAPEAANPPKSAGEG